MNYQDILDYWFGDIENGLTRESRGQLWYGNNPEIDQDIRQRFELILQSAAHGELDNWKNTPRGRLALIILFDQFTRNIYRKSAQAFAYDHLAQELVTEGIERGHDEQLEPVEQSFFYMPLEHAEDLKLQRLCVERMQHMLEKMPAETRPQLESSLDYAHQHHDIIECFGRFPHRNEVLGRESTEEEREYLKSANRYGQ